MSFKPTPTFAMTAASSLPPATTAATFTLQTLTQWSESGWLRRLDSAMAQFIWELDENTTEAALMATAILTHMEGRGHSCLPIAEFVAQPQGILAWPQPAADALAAWWLSFSPSSLAEWHQALRRCAAVRYIPTGLDAGSRAAPDLGQPLVLTGGSLAPRLYLRRYLDYEKSLAQQIKARTSHTLAVDGAQVRTWLDRLFAVQVPLVEAVATASNKQQPDWQKLACALAVHKQFTIITGGPGTGKTYTAARLLALLLALSPDPLKLRVVLAAPTGKAAARLKQSIDISMKDLHEPLQGHLDLTALTQRIGAARTLHSVLGARPDTRQFRFDESHRLDLDVLVVDEASMVHLEMMVAVMKALPPRARLVLLGDKDQLASVEAGALLGDLCRPAEAGGYGANFAQQLEASSGETLPPSVVVPDADAKPLAQHIIMLRKSHRFGGPIGQLATAVNQGDAQAAAKAFDQDTNGALLALFGVHADKIVQLAVAEESGGDRASYQGYAAHVAQWPRLNDRNAADAVVQHEAWVKSVLVAFDRFRVLCAVREGPWGTVGLNQAIAQELTRQGLLQAHGEWYAGRPIMITRNDAVLGVFNGDIGVVLPALHGGAGLRAYFLDGEVLRSIAVSRLAHVESAFALTVHKSQGSEYAHAVVALPAHAGQLLSRELVYTGVTRAKRALTLVTEHTGLLASALQHATQRASGLLDFLEDETHVN